MSVSLSNIDIKLFSIILQDSGLSQNAIYTAFWRIENGIDPDFVYTDFVGLGKRYFEVDQIEFLAKLGVPVIDNDLGQTVYDLFKDRLAYRDYIGSWDGKVFYRS